MLEVLSFHLTGHPGGLQPGGALWSCASPSWGGAPVGGGGVPRRGQGPRLMGLPEAHIGDLTWLQMFS